MKCLALCAVLLVAFGSLAEAKHAKRANKAATRIVTLLGQIGAAPLLVKDSQGKIVGTVIEAGSEVQVTAVATIRGTPVTVLVFTDHLGGTNVFAPTGSFGYTTADCSGPRLAIESFDPSITGVMLPTSVVVGTRLVYPQPGPFTTTALLATEEFTATDATSCATVGGTFTAQGICCLSGQDLQPTAPTVLVDVSSLGWTPPFHVEGP